MSEEEMAKLPGVILQTSEYDFFRFDVKAFIPKLQKAGTYLDHADYARDGHGVGEEGLWQNFDLYHEDHVRAWKEYAIKGAPKLFEHK